MRKSIFVAALALALTASQADAQLAKKTVTLGVLNDQSSVYSDMGGAGSVLAARMAVEDFGGTVAGAKIELIFADHQLKPDVASAITNKWLQEDGVDAVIDLGAGGPATAALDVVKKYNKTLLLSASSLNYFTGPGCAPQTVHWTYDNWSMANATVTENMRAGAKRWFFLVPDYRFGWDMQEVMTDMVKKSGGEVVGVVRYSPRTLDYSSFLLQAQQNKPDIVAMIDGGDNLARAMKQANEFEFAKANIRMTSPVAQLTDVHAMGLAVGQGLITSESYYWDLNENTRAFGKRFAALRGGRMPTSIQAGVYSVVTHYLEAVAASNSTDGDVVVRKMKATKGTDKLFGTYEIRADGRALHNRYIMRVKSPTESKGPWDYLAQVAVIPWDKAYLPMSEGGCPLLDKM